MFKLTIYIFLFFKLLYCKISVHLIPFTRVNSSNPFNYSIVLNYLKNNHKSTFTIIDIIHFEEWVNSNSNNFQIILNLTQNKQLEFIIDGIKDEKKYDNYKNIFNDLRRKLKYILHSLNYFPLVSFFASQHTTNLENLSLYRKMGFKYLLLNEINTDYKNELISKKNLEFKWKVSDEDNEGIITHILNDIKTPDFLKELFSEKQLDLSNSTLEDYINNLINYGNKTLNGFKHNNLLLLYGGDNAFNESISNFENIEKLMNYINENDKYKDVIEVMYSSFENYFHIVEKSLRNESLFVYEHELPLNKDNNEKNSINYFLNNPYLRGREYEINNFMNSLFVYNIDLVYGNKSKLSFYNFQNEYLGKMSLKLSSNEQEEIYNSTEQNLKKSLKDLIALFFNNKPDYEMCLSNNKVNLGCKIEFKENKEKYKLGIINPRLEGRILITLETDIKNENISFRIEDKANNEIEYNFICVPNYKCFINFFYNFYTSQLIVQISLIDIERNKNLNNKKKFDFPITELKGFNSFLKHIEYNTEDYLFNIEFKNKKSIKYKFSINEIELKSSSEMLFENNNTLKHKINYEQSYIINSEISTCLILKLENNYLVLNIYKEPFFIQIISIINENKDKNKIIGLAVNSDINNNGIIYHDYKGMKMKEYSINFNNNINDNIFIVHKAMSLFSEEEKKKLTLFVDRPNVAVSYKEKSLLYILNNENEIIKNEKLEFKFILSIDELFDEEVNEISINYFEKNLMIFYDKNNDIEVNVPLPPKNPMNPPNRRLLEGKIKSIRNLQKNELKMIFDSYKIINVYFNYAYSLQLFIHSGNINLRPYYIEDKKILFEFYNELDEYFIHNIDFRFNNKNLSILKGNISECCIRGVNCKGIKGLLRRLQMKLMFVDYDIQPNNFKVFTVNFE